MNPHQIVHLSVAVNEQAVEDLIYHGFQIEMERAVRREIDALLSRQVRAAVKAAVSKAAGEGALRVRVRELCEDDSNTNAVVAKVVREIVNDVRAEMKKGSA